MILVNRLSHFSSKKIQLLNAHFFKAASSFLSTARRELQRILLTKTDFSTLFREKRTYSPEQKQQRSVIAQDRKQVPAQQNCYMFMAEKHILWYWRWAD